MRVTLPAELLEQLFKESTATNQRPTDIIRDALIKHLEKHTDAKGKNNDYNK